MVKALVNIYGTATDDFHIYRLDWAPYGIRGYFDNEKVFEYLNSGGSSATWPYDKKFHMLLNIAVGGNWGGAQGIDDTSFPPQWNRLCQGLSIYKVILLRTFSH